MQPLRDHTLSTTVSLRRIRVRLFQHGLNRRVGRYPAAAVRAKLLQLINHALKEYLEPYYWVSGTCFVQ